MPSPRILIVDDNPADVDLLQAYMAELSVDVRGLTDSRLVEEVFREYQPDIVLIDLHMPNVDGLEVLRRLRSWRERLGFLPVVMLTADTGHTARNAALILGADDFINKPLDRLEVLMRVRNLLRTRHLFDELSKAKGTQEDSGHTDPRGT